MDMKGIARSNFKMQKEGSLLRVQSHARIFSLTVPPGVTQVSIHKPKIIEAALEGICASANQVGPTKFFPGIQANRFPFNPGQIWRLPPF